jgi:hypothetical protein
MAYMKRSMMILALASSLIALPTISHAVTPAPSFSPLVSASPIATSSPLAPAAKRAARAAAKATFKEALLEAQNGRDLAFADINATLVQAMSAAGKDRAAKAAARASYKSAAQGIITAYRQSIANANTIYKTALAALK